MRTLVLREISEICDALSFRRMDLLHILASCNDDALFKRLKAHIASLRQIESQLGEVVSSGGEVQLCPRVRSRATEIPSEARADLDRLLSAHNVPTRIEVERVDVLVKDPICEQEQRRAERRAKARERLIPREGEFSAYRGPTSLQSSCDSCRNGGGSYWVDSARTLDGSEDRRVRSR